MLAKGQPVPDFSLASDGGKTISKASLLGSRYVLYFYPKDDTPGCTKEACGFRDAEVDFGKISTKVFGISADSTSSHEKFIKKYSLNFPLLSDPERVLIEGLGCWVEKSMYGKKYMGIARATFVIDGKGLIEQVWEKVNVDTHAADVLNYLNGGVTQVSAKPIAVRKATSKQAAAKKAPAKKAATTKSATVKKATAKKVPAQKVPAKKVPAKKVAAKKSAMKKKSAAGK
jgi:thioredoxin-dependent peroxiredoxin